MARKYVRYEHRGTIAYGQIEGNTIRELAGSLFDSPRPTSRTVALADARLLVPTNPTKVIGVGLNYIGPGREVPDAPFLFTKYPSSLVGSGDAIVLPRQLPEVVGEVELVVVIGRQASAVPVTEALDYVFGVAVGNDVTGRVSDINQQILLAKASDTFAPVGPYIATGIDYGDLTLVASINGRQVTAGNTRDLAHDIPTLVSHISQFVTLEAGDLIFTGAPGMTPPLHHGDVVEVSIEGVGSVTNHVVVASPGPSADASGIVGTWRLTRFMNVVDGKEVYPFGEHPLGYFTYTPEGRVMIQIQRATAPESWESLEPDRGFGPTYPWYVGYFGRYSLDADEGTVIHHVEGGTFLHYIGTDQRRPYAIDGDRLFVGERGMWERELVRVR